MNKLTSARMINDVMKSQKKFTIETDNEFSYRVYLDGPRYQNAFEEIIEYLDQKHSEIPNSEDQSPYSEIKWKIAELLKDY